MTTLWMSVDGELQPSKDARLGALEAGSAVGWGVFTTGAIVNERPIFLEEHITRLHSDGAKSRLFAPGIDLAPWADSWRQSLGRVIKANAITGGHFRLTLCARGEGRWHPEGAPRLLVAAASSSLEASPVDVWLSPYHADARRPLAGVKSTSYAPWLVMAAEARALGCGDALYRDSRGSLCEGARSNVFWRRGREVSTPTESTGCLPGIARRFLLRWMGDPNSPWTPREAQAPAEELLRAEEIFLSNATLGPRAVRSIRGADGEILWRDQGSQECCSWLRRLWLEEISRAPGA